MSYKGQCEDCREEDGVVEAEVIQILAYPASCFRNGVWLGERGEICEVSPWPALRESVVPCIGEAGHESSDLGGWRQGRRICGGCR